LHYIYIAKNKGDIMNEAESIMELLPMIGEITPSGNYLVFKSNRASYEIYELDKAKSDIAQIRHKLELMGIRDIPIQHAMTLEVNYRYAKPAQQKTLNAIMNAQVRFNALKTLFYNGGFQLSPVEQKYFQAKAAQRNAMRATFAAKQAQNVK